MRIVRMRTASGVCTAISLALAGCSEQDWQPGNQNKSANADAGTKAGPPKDDSKAGSETQTAKSQESTRTNQADDPQARDVESRVADYASTVQHARYDGAADGGDFNSKIARHNDPEYRRRIRESAKTAYEQKGREGDRSNGEPSPPNDGAGAEPDAESPAVNTSTGDGHGSDAVRKGQSDPAESTEGVEAKSVMPPVKPDESASNPNLNSTAGSTPPIRVNEETHEPHKGTSGQEPPQPPVLGSVKTGAEPGTREPTATEGNAGGNQAATVAATIGANKSSEERPEKPTIATNTPTNPPPRESTPDHTPAKVETVVKDTYRDRIRELEGRIAKDPNNIDDQFRLRMLYLASGEDEKAVTITEGMNEDTAKLVTAYIQAIKRARAQTGRDPASWANEQLPTIEALRDLIRSQADLQVPRVMMCESIEGYGVYEPIDPPQFVQGQKGKALLYIEVDNYQSEKTASGKYRTLLSLRLSLLDKNGKELWSQPPTDNIEDVSRERRRDFFLTYGPLTIPKDLGPGSYVLKVEVEDVLAQKTNSGTAEFKIVQR